MFQSAATTFSDGKKLTTGTALYKLIEEAVEQAWGNEYDAAEHIHLPQTMSSAPAGA